MRILIADDHAVVRRGMKDILMDAFGKPTIAEASEAAETLQLVRKQKWDIVILDISIDRKSTRLNSSHSRASRMPSSA